MPTCSLWLAVIQKEGAGNYLLYHPIDWLLALPVVWMDKAIATPHPFKTMKPHIG